MARWFLSGLYLIDCDTRLYVNVLSWSCPLAELLDGELTVTSELGQGAAFTLTIPKKLSPKQAPAKTKPIGN